MKSFLREPLVHFVLLGALLFLLPSGQGDSSAEAIVVTPGRIEAMVAAFSRTWQRLPTEKELQGLVEDYVREEVYVREAIALRLDEDDTIIRRRLRQKMEFLAEDAGAVEPPTEAELQGYLQQHPEKFVLDPEIQFVQIYLDPERRGEDLDADAGALLERLRAGDVPESEWDELGDRLLLPTAISMKRRREVERLFGSGFAAAVFELEEGPWQGLLESGYGWHLVRVDRKLEERVPELSEVRKAVEREYLFEERERRSEELYARLAERYRVEIRWPEVDAEVASSEPAS